MECLFVMPVCGQQPIEETGGFFPIPVSQVNLSAGVLVQDPAWEGAGAIYTD